MKDESYQQTKASYLTKKETSDNEVGGRPPLGVHWDQSRRLSQLHSHVLHLAVAQHSQQSLHSSADQQKSLCVKRMCLPHQKP